MKAKALGCQSTLNLRICQQRVATMLEALLNITKRMKLIVIRPRPAPLWIKHVLQQRA